MNNGTLLAVKIKDRRVFQMLSSVHSLNEVEIGRNDHATGHPITKPEIVHEYNKYMRASSAMSAKLPFAFKIVFSSTILFRTMLLPIFEDTMQIMIMMMMKIVIN